MAGIFGLFDFTKPGPGVPRPDEESPKSGFRIFFEILRRKFWKISGVGMLFFILNLPAFILATLVAYYFIAQLTSTAEEALSMTNLLYWGAALLVLFPLINIGPVRAGLEGVFRNYSREEHSFIWDEYKGHMKTNLKQSLIISLLNLIVLILLVFDFILIRFMVFKSDVIWAVFNAMYILTFLVYLMMNLYLYPLMVTFELSIKNLIKNAFIFAFGRFFTNLFILVVVFGLLTLPFMYLNPVFASIVSFFLLYGILGFLQSFYAHRGFKKFFYDKMPAKPADDMQEDKF